MSAPTPATPLLSHARLVSAWTPGDIILLIGNALLVFLVLLRAVHLEEPGFYAVLHLSIMFGVVGMALHASSSRSRLFAFIHNWLPALYVVGTYFELGYLIPQVRPFLGYPYDHALQTIDVMLLGDPAAFFAQLAWAPLSDVLTVCYWAYYPLALALPVIHYARGNMSEFHRVVAITVSAFMVAYVGYVLLPAVGPHKVFDTYRTPELDGYGLAQRAYIALCQIPYEPPDAFPSGHSLVGILAPALAWRLDRRLALALLPLGLGMVMATLYLRFHYVADVLASIALAPVCLWLGEMVTRRALNPE